MRLRSKAVRGELLSERITGWAVNVLFPIPGVPNLYSKFPWRRIRRTRGPIWGTLFVVNLLAIWCLELGWQVMFLRDDIGE
jgi:hypothetical protein